MRVDYNVVVGGVTAIARGRFPLEMSPMNALVAVSMTDTVVELMPVRDEGALSVASPRRRQARSRGYGRHHRVWPGVDDRDLVGVMVGHVHAAPVRATSTPAGCYPSIVAATVLVAVSMTATVWKPPLAR